MADRLPAAARAGSVDRLAALDLDTSWMERAACAGWPVNLWEPTTDRARIARAAAICAGCPVRPECRHYGVTSGSPGVWGGEMVGISPRPATGAEGAGEVA
jgi:hypothetical protein